MEKLIASNNVGYECQKILSRCLAYHNMGYIDGKFWGCWFQNFIETLHIPYITILKFIHQV